ncbi:uncharacterized protein EI97DRAFT_451520 [Westerdykella ornata]|uniref:MARVEL domain-containing protein n=1 Tax=Westerdykella ornata TaxID=318751 RepID=A0A6A6JDN1_WESOR|nr:uncharacterized protein EI97DRAFT_451520 [Westerdykella ornata]KAF2274720.1 hypothetical protein EI97DRAFT_451520 [Westerdykella ornata]
MVSKALNIVFRIWEFICTIIIMSLIGNMIATAFAGNPSAVNYAMFVSAFGMASLLYLIPAAIIERLQFPPLSSVLDGLNVIFWFCAAVALPSYLHVHSCSNRWYVLHNSITNGSHDPEKRCRMAQASTAFLWFGWVAWIVTLVISLMSIRGGANLRGGARKPGPSMSQV